MKTRLFRKKVEFKDIGKEIDIFVMSRIVDKDNAIVELLGKPQEHVLFEIVVSENVKTIEILKPVCPLKEESVKEGLKKFISDEKLLEKVLKLGKILIGNSKIFLGEVLEWTARNLLPTYEKHEKLSIEEILQEINKVIKENKFDISMTNNEIVFVISNTEEWSYGNFIKVTYSSIGVGLIITFRNEKELIKFVRGILSSAYFEELIEPFLKLLEKSRNEMRSIDFGFPLTYIS